MAKRKTSRNARVAVVTGGAGALGRAVVKRLVAEGWRCHVPWVIEAEVALLRKALGPQAGAVALHHVDLTSEAATARLFQEAARASGGLDLLANLAGGFLYAGLEATDLAAFRRMLDMNAVSAFSCCRAAVPLLKQRGGGRIVNVGAYPALGRGAAQMSAYAAAKAALLNLTYSLSAELLPARITVNAIVPTIIDTPANRKAMPDAATATWLKPEELAGVIAFLAGPEAATVTGAAITLAR